MKFTFEIRAFCVAEGDETAFPPVEEIAKGVQEILKEQMDTDAEVVIENLHYN